MKKMKWAALLAAVMTTVGFTSCLDGENSTTAQGAPILKVESGYMGMDTYFIDQAGVKYRPEKMIVPDASRVFAQVPLQYDTSLYNEQDNSFNITLLGEPLYLTGYHVASVPDGEEKKNTVTFTIIDDGYNGRGAVWDKKNEYLLLPVSYPIPYDVNTKDKLVEELRKHHLSFYTVEGKELSEDKVLQLYARYTIDGVTEDKELEFQQKYNAANAEWCYLTIRNIPKLKDAKKIKVIYEKSTSLNRPAVNLENKEEAYVEFQLFEAK